jgi:hypothetical protein
VKGSYEDDGHQGDYSVGYKQGFNQGYHDKVLPSPTTNGAGKGNGNPPKPDSTVIPDPPQSPIVSCCNSYDDDVQCNITFDG